LLLAYSYPIRVYLSQQAEIAQLEQEHAVQRAHIDDLAVERANWDDPEFVKTQARKRFHLVERGDKTYVVFFDSAGAAQASAAAADQAGGRTEPPWYARLWSSIDAANKPPER
jgi:GTP-dependent phosphoenolpyruvate carboxykinase